MGGSSSENNASVLRVKIYHVATRGGHRPYYVHMRFFFQVFCLFDV
jgi:hypothetical protein